MLEPIKFYVIGALPDVPYWLYLYDNLASVQQIILQKRQIYMIIQSLHDVLYQLLRHKQLLLAWCLCAHQRKL